MFTKVGVQDHHHHHHHQPFSPYLLSINSMFVEACVALLLCTSSFSHLSSLSSQQFTFVILLLFKFEIEAAAFKMSEAVVSNPHLGSCVRADGSLLTYSASQKGWMKQTVVKWKRIEYYMWSWNWICRLFLSEWWWLSVDSAFKSECWMRRTKGKPLLQFHSLVNSCSSRLWMKAMAWLAAQGEGSSQKGNIM